MTSISLLKNSQNEIIGLEFEGHAGYANEGMDIVCAAVSALSINLVNSIEKFTNEKFILDSYDGYLKFILNERPNKESELLIKSAILGIEMIKEQYGDKYINIKIQEVK